MVRTFFFRLAVILLSTCVTSQAVEIPRSSGIPPQITFPFTAQAFNLEAVFASHFILAFKFPRAELAGIARPIFFSDHLKRGQLARQEFTNKAPSNNPQGNSPAGGYFFTVAALLWGLHLWTDWTVLIPVVWVQLGIGFAQMQSRLLKKTGVPSVKDLWDAFNIDPIFEEKAFLLQTPILRTLFGAGIMLLNRNQHPHWQTAAVFIAGMLWVSVLSQVATYYREHDRGEWNWKSAILQPQRSPSFAWPAGALTLTLLSTWLLIDIPYMKMFICMGVLLMMWLIQINHSENPSHRNSFIDLWQSFTSPTFPENKYFSYPTPVVLLMAGVFSSVLAWASGSQAFLYAALDFLLFSGTVALSYSLFLTAAQLEEDDRWRPDQDPPLLDRFLKAWMNSASKVNLETEPRTSTLSAWGLYAFALVFFVIAMVMGLSDFSVRHFFEEHQPKDQKEEPAKPLPKSIENTLASIRIALALLLAALFSSDTVYGQRPIPNIPDPASMSRPLPGHLLIPLTS